MVWGMWGVRLLLILNRLYWGMEGVRKDGEMRVEVVFDHETT